MWSARTILEGLLKTHSYSLNDESIRTLMAETELDFEVEVEKPLSQSNILTMKTIVVVNPSGEFSIPDMCSKWDGNMYNILPEYSGANGERNFSRVYNL